MDASQIRKGNTNNRNKQSSLLNHFVLRTIRPNRETGTTTSTNNSATSSTTTTTSDTTKASAVPIFDHTTRTKKRPSPTTAITHTNNTRRVKRQKRTDESLKQRAVAVINGKQRRKHTQKRFSPLPPPSNNSNNTSSTTHSNNNNNNTADQAPPPLSLTAHASTRCTYCLSTSTNNASNDVTPAAVLILPKPRPAVGIVSESSDSYRRKPLCLMHYYTTRYSRTTTNRVKPIGDGKEMERQLPVVRELFRRAFLEVQSDIREESARSWRKMKHDPLKGLLGIGTGVTKTKARTKRKAKTPTSDSSGTKRHNNHNNKGEKDKGEGGFLKDVQPLEKALLSEQRRRIETAAHESDRIVVASSDATDTNHNKNQRQQQKQKQKKHTTTIQLPTKTSQQTRNNGGTTRSKSNLTSRTSTTTTIQTKTNTNAQPKPNVHKRRRAGANIWTTVLNPQAEFHKQRRSSTNHNHNFDVATLHHGSATCRGCGGTENIHVLGNVVARNNDVNKADIWGMARDGDISTRYECGSCGCKWNEED